MTENFTSVTLFYAALRDVLLAEAGMTVERTLDTYDVVLTGAGGYARLRKVVVSTDVSAVSLLLGVDPDVLAVSTDDPLLCLPFDTTTPERMYVDIRWRAARGVLPLLLAPNPVVPLPTNPLRSYRAEFKINTQDSLVVRENPPSTVSGGPYIQVGA